jgi:hypothetical protein
MTATTWRPFVDAPLFAGELLLGPDALPADLTTAIVGYLGEVAAARTAPLHTCTAFNALHFGFDVPTRSYRAAVLDPALFTAVPAGPAARPVLPVGTFVRLDRGRHSLWAEVVARYGADPLVDATDGWVPAEVSGAPGHTLAGAGHGTWERTVLDFEAFGSPLSAVERTELHRARQRGNLLDRHGHLLGPATCTPADGDTGPDIRDDVTLYSAHLLGSARPLLTGGPLGGLLTDPDDDTVLAAALRQAFVTVDALLDRAGLRRFAGYATPAERFNVRRRTGWPGLPAAEIDEVVHVLARPAAAPRYTAVWPLLATATTRHDTGDDPLELASAADLTMHVNLATADLTLDRATTVDAAGGDLRVDDLWQSGGVWRTQLAPVPTELAAHDPLQPLGLGHHGAQQPPQGLAGEPGENLSPEPLAERNPSAEPPGTQDTTSDPVSDVDFGVQDDEWDPDGRPVISDVVVVDSLVVCAVTLRESHLDGDLLPVAAACAKVLADGNLVVELHHDGDPLDDTERVHRVTVDRAETTSPDGTSRVRVVLHGVAWPLGFYPGIKVRVAVVRGAQRISATTTLLEVPSPVGDEFRWDADQAVLAAALGLSTPGGDTSDDGAEKDLTEASHEDDESVGVRQVLDRHHGIDQLRTMIVAVLRRHGRPGAFGARRLTGPQLLAAMFGDDVVDPRLLWQVIYTCERLTDAGRLTREPNPAQPDRPHSGGPDTFVWWPDDTARRQAQQAHASRPPQSGVLTGQVREQWVPPHIRLLPSGYRASDTARDAYAAWASKVRGHHTPTEIPDGYTFVRGGPRGTLQDGTWIHLATTSTATDSR